MPTADDILGLTKRFRVVVRHVEMREYYIEAATEAEAKTQPQVEDLESEWEYREDSSWEVVDVETLE